LAGTGKILVVSQVALCLLLFGAGLFMRSLQKLDGQDEGFDRDTLLVVRVEPRGSDQRGIEGTSARLDNMRDLLERVAAIPACARPVSLTSVPSTGWIRLASPAAVWRGQDRAETDGLPELFCDDGYTDSRGSRSHQSDLVANPPFVGVVNEAFVRQFMDGENPLESCSSNEETGLARSSES
jgi:hypothetical protein